MTVRGQCFFVFNVSRRWRPDAYAIDVTPRAALDAVADAERDYLKKSTEARKNVLVARATLRGLAAATNATSAENATAVIEESGLGAKVKKLMPFGGSPKSNRDDALNALADATKEQQVAELDYLGVVASHLPDDVARRRLGQLASEGRDGTLEGSLSDALSFLRNATEAKRAYVLQFDGDPAASQTANLREEVTAVLKTADSSRGDEVVLKLTTGGGTVTGYGLAAAQLLRLKDAGLKLTVCVEQVAASGGYMMACCGDKIIASPFAVLGSIGVITDIPNAYERLKQEGIEFQTVTAGDFKRTVTPTKKVTKEDLAKTEADIKEIFSLFKKFVKGQRPSLDIEKVATGETWFGQDALDRHLCDELRTFDDVKLDLFEAGAEVLQVSYSPPPTTPLEALLQPAGSSSLVELAKAALPVLSSLASLDVKAGQPLALDADIRDRYRLQDDRWMS
jgi:serine protease SohB